VPVIYHDWTLTESGFDIPINAVSAEQFLNLRPSGHIKEYHQGVTNDRKGSILVPTANATTDTTESAPDTLSTLLENPVVRSRVNRSNSMGALTGGKSDRTTASRKLDLTKTNKTGKLKGNGPESIQAPFTTLAEIFRVSCILL
jgi:glycerophosphodiester phosphodiesterase